jgi:hypothetical protein
MFRAKISTRDGAIVLSECALNAAIGHVRLVLLSIEERKALGSTEKVHFSQPLKESVSSG